MKPTLTTPHRVPILRPTEVRREDDAPDDQACNHRNVRGSKYLSRYCPNCAAPLLVPVDEDDENAEAFNARKVDILSREPRRSRHA